MNADNMASNLHKSFELLNAVMGLKMAYFKKIYPDKTEAELNRKIHQDIIREKERQWKSQMN
jgi:hypothetical protein